MRSSFQAAAPESLPVCNRDFALDLLPWSARSDSFPALWEPSTDDPTNSTGVQSGRAFAPSPLALSRAHSGKKAADSLYIGVAVRSNVRNKMTLPPLYKYLDVNGAKLTLGNRTFRHANPCSFKDLEDMTHWEHLSR
jgi:hypothetical protein